MVDGHVGKELPRSRKLYVETKKKLLCTKAARRSIVSKGARIYLMMASDELSDPPSPTSQRHLDCSVSVLAVI